jgi:hypothetical protein
MYGSFNWFLSVCRHTRLLSKTLTSLFSVGVTGSPKTYFLGVIDQLATELEAWRLSVPPNFRPAGLHENQQQAAPIVLRQAETNQVAVAMQYFYSSFLLILNRTTLHLAGNSEEVVDAERQAACKTAIMKTSRAILGLTTYVEVEPYTPLWYIHPEFSAESPIDEPWFSTLSWH